MDHLVGRQAQVARPPVQVQQRRPVGHLPLQPLDQRPALGPADPSRRLVPQLQPQSPPRRHLLEHGRIAPQLVPARGQRRPGRPLLLAAACIAGDHRVPRRVVIAAGRRERVGTLPVQERQVILPVREPGRDQPVPGHPQLHPLGGEEQVETRDHPLQDGHPLLGLGVAVLVQQQHVRPARDPGLDPQRRAESGAIRVGAGTVEPVQHGDHPGRRAVLRVDRVQLAELGGRLRRQAVLDRPPGRRVSRRESLRLAPPAVAPSHSSAGQKPGTRFTTSSRSSSSFPPGRSSTRRSPSTVAGSCASPRRGNRSGRRGRAAPPGRAPAAPSEPMHPARLFVRRAFMLSAFRSSLCASILRPRGTWRR